MTDDLRDGPARDADEEEFRETIRTCLAWLEGKPAECWLWLARQNTGDHGEYHDDRGIRKWIESRPEYRAAIAGGFSEDEIEAVGARWRPYDDAATYDLYRNYFWIGRSFPRPGSGEWAAWWKKVGGDPEKYWKNEPVFGYPQTWLGHLLRWSFGAFCVVVMIWGMAACVRLRSG